MAFVLIGKECETENQCLESHRTHGKGDALSPPGVILEQSGGSPSVPDRKAEAWKPPCNGSRNSLSQPVQGPGGQ